MSHMYHDNVETGICCCISHVAVVAHLPCKAQHGVVVSMTPAVVLQPNMVMPPLPAVGWCFPFLPSPPLFMSTRLEDSWVRTSCFFTCLLLDYVLPGSELCSCLLHDGFWWPSRDGRWRRREDLVQPWGWFRLRLSPEPCCQSIPQHAAVVSVWLSN